MRKLFIILSLFLTLSVSGQTVGIIASQTGVSWSSYWLTRTPSTLILSVLSGTSVKLDWTNGENVDYDGISIERSVDGVTYTAIDIVGAEIVTYTDNDITNGVVYFYRVRAYSGSNSSNYTNTYSNYSIGLTPQGSADGRQIMELEVSEDIIIKFDGTGRFYDDAACTVNASITKTVVAGSSQIIYWKSPTAADKLRYSDPTKIIKIKKWAGEYYSPVVSCNISYFKNISYFNFAPELSVHTYVYGTITGSITGLPLTYIKITSASTITGDITPMSLTYFRTTGAVTGSISNSTGITYLYCAGAISGSLDGMNDLSYLRLTSTGNTVSGSLTNKTLLTGIITAGSSLTADVTNLTNLQVIQLTEAGLVLTGSITNLISLNYLQAEYTNTLSGSLSGLTLLTYFNVLGSNTISGNLDSLTLLQLFQGGRTVTCNNVTNLKNLCYLSFTNSVNLSETKVNQILADFWLNRNEVKPLSYRIINLTGDVSTSSPTGQGIIDAANLAAYRSPNNGGSEPLWTVTVRGNTVSFVGTSITAGSGADPLSLRYSTVFCGLDADTENNVGASGRRLHGTGGLRETCVTDIPDFSNSSKYLIIEIGANDTDWETYGGSVFQVDLDYVIQYAVGYKSWPANRIKILTTFNTSMNWAGLIPYYNAVGTLRGVQVIDTGTQIYNSGDYSGNMLDNVHPNNTGHDLMADYIKANIIF